MRGTLPMDFLTYFKINNTDDNTSPANTMYYEEQTPAEKATERVATLIGNDFFSTDLFCQMDVLRNFKEDLIWQEMARWVRYEEAVEEGGQRWSKPHVASLMMEALQDLQDILITCPILLDCKATLMSDIVENVLDAWLRDRSFAVMLRNHFRSILLKPHKFQHFTKKDTKSVKKKPTSLKLKEAYINGGYDPDKLQGISQYCPDSPSLALGSQNKSFMRKIPQGAEAVNLLIGEVEELERTVAAFIRLKTPTNVGDITEVDIDTKFIFILLGPKDYLGHCAEIGRCMAALFTDEIFRCVSYRARDRGDILAGVHEFSLHLTVLPPGTWDPSTRIEPPEAIPSQDYRKTMTTSKSTGSLTGLEKTTTTTEAEGGEGHGDPTLVRTGRLFGGLIADIKRKIPFYKSDFKDALHIQCVASFFFLFLATLTPNVTFGGLLSQATDDYMGAMECILSACISGVLFALFAGQPLNILGSTGPMLVLEAILYRFCKDQDWDFMPFRVWVGFWTGFMILLIVAFDLSALVRYITRFTEESFACLIALIFIYEAFKKTFGISKEAKVHFHPTEDSHNCFCIMENSTYLSLNDKTYTTTATIITTNNNTNITHNGTADSFYSECTMNGGTLFGEGCTDKYTPDVFFFSLILFFGTYTLATTLVRFRHSLFFPTWVRTNVSDFAVLISIIIMVCLDAATGIPTPKLTVPTEFKSTETGRPWFIYPINDRNPWWLMILSVLPAFLATIRPTKAGRPWFINPISDKNPWWLMILSVLPAFLATILIFMDQQITAVIVNRRENKLKKGSGYHLDMLIVGILVVVLSLLGLPWYVAATVTALAHIMSLRKVSECTAPGERPVFLGVREQRVTALLVGIFSGMAVFFTSVLRYIPMPVLYGVFLFMGVAPLSGMQLVQRILLVFMPTKYQPEYSYIRNVPIKRVHIFTAVQVICLALLWVIKSVKSISIGFPLMVLFICFIRKALDKVFTQRELKWLDDILPATEVKKGEEEVEENDTKPPPPKEPQPIKIQIDEPKMDSRAPTPIPLDQPQGIIPIHPAAPTIPTVTEETDVDEEPTEAFKNVLIPRMSLTFMLRSDLEQLKANAPAPPELRVDRRKSLAMAVERKKSVQEGRIYGVPQRRISGHSLLDGRRSHDGSLLDLHRNSTPSIIEEHNKLNRLLSMPATITDEDESQDDASK